jgi:putative ABC transport system permease protein
MPATDIGWVGLAASLVLVAVALGLSFWLRLGLEGSIAWAATRAAAQLAIVGWALVLVLDEDSPVALAWLWVGVMILAASLTIRHRAREVPGAFAIGLVAISSVAVVSLGVIFGFGIFPVESRTIVPLAGMMIGNSMAATILASRSIVREVAERRDEVEAHLSLGQPWRTAAHPYVRQALRTALTPQIESTKVVGLIALPGAMTGLILAGVEPVDAVQVQLAIMYLILGSVATSVTVVSLGLTRRLFTPDHRLVRLPTR